MDELEAQSAQSAMTSEGGPEPTDQNMAAMATAGVLVYTLLQALGGLIDIPCEQLLANMAEVNVDDAMIFEMHGEAGEPGSFVRCRIDRKEEEVETVD